MSELEEKLNTVLNNPRLMQQIMTMAHSMNQSSTDTKEQSSNDQPLLPDIDPNMLKRLSGIAQNGSIDKNQKSLLSALAPYLSRERILKLEKAMRAARMAKMASVFLNSSQFLSGR